MRRLTCLSKNAKRRLLLEAPINIRKGEVLTCVRAFCKFQGWRNMKCSHQRNDWLQLATYHQYPRALVRVRLIGLVEVGLAKQLFLDVGCTLLQLMNALPAWSGICT